MRVRGKEIREVNREGKGERGTKYKIKWRKQNVGLSKRDRQRQREDDREKVRVVEL